MEITVAADGSALGNPGPAGWAWYVDENCWSAGGWIESTNNRGELMAVVDFLEKTSAIANLNVHVLCDSQYVINSVTKGMPGWKRRGWRKADGKAVLNDDLMKRLDQGLAGRTVDFRWVKGHAGHTLNEKVDQLARGAATAYQRGLSPHTGPGLSPELRALASNSQPTSNAVPPTSTAPAAPLDTRDTGIQETLF